MGKLIKNKAMHKIRAQLAKNTLVIENLSLKILY